jgi:5-methylcytosine-specific restriction endonuclease McrA
MDGLMRINSTEDAEMRALDIYSNALQRGSHKAALLAVWLNGDAHGRLRPQESVRERVRKRKPQVLLLKLPRKEDWRALRYRALRMAGGKCQCCGSTPDSSGHPLHVDHIKPKSKYPELAMEFSNLQVLCKDCNFGKNKWDETDWRKMLPEGVE